MWETPTTSPPLPTPPIQGKSTRQILQPKTSLWEIKFNNHRRCHYRYHSLFEDSKTNQDHRRCHYRYHSLLKNGKARNQDLQDAQWKKKP